MESIPTSRDRDSGSQGGSARRRVLIVDNSADLAQALVSMIALEDDLESVGYVSSGADALSRMQCHAADVIVLDLGLADCSGFTVLDRLRQEQPDVRVVIYTGHASAELYKEAITRGAVGCVLKGDDLGILLAAIRTA